jgi:hypothetical protein
MKSKKENDMSVSNNHRQVVARLLESKAVDFTAIGKVLGEVGPGLAVADYEGDWFCGTNRIFIHVLRVWTPDTPVDPLGELGAEAEELQS